MSKKRERSNSKQAVDSPACFSSIKTKEFLKPVTPNHRLLKNSILHKDITICLGPPGSAKTTLSAQTAIHLINNQSNDFNRIVYIRSNVQTRDEKELGAFKGDFDDKVYSLALPLVDAMLNFVDMSEVKSMFEYSKIEVTTLGYIRGRSFRNAIIIADEVENFTLHGFKTVMSRVEQSSKLVLIGDPDQSDLYYKNNKSDVSYKVANALKDMDNVGVVFMDYNDIVRNGMIPELMSRLNSIGN